MTNKSKIRQTALNLLYAIEENGGDPQNLDLELFWRITQEKATNRYRQALAKGIVHVCRASADGARLLETRANAALEALEGDLTARSLHADIARLAKRSAEFEAALGALQYCMRDKRQDTTDQLGLCCQDALVLARAVEGLGRDLLPLLGDFPAYRAVLEPLGAAIRRRGRLLAACAALSTPLALEGQSEYTALVRCARSLQELRPATEAFVKAVLDKKPTFDAALQDLLHNYSADRLDLVDKCIIYISLYELAVNKLDIPIVVSEAASLADAYSGGKSAPFIHGIIAAAHKRGL